MKTNRRTNILDQVLDEFIVYGQLTVTRREVMSDLKAKDASAAMIDFWVFRKDAVAAPIDPESHVAMLRQIQAMGW